MEDDCSRMKQASASDAADELFLLSREYGHLRHPCRPALALCQPDRQNGP